MMEVGNMPKSEAKAQHVGGGDESNCEMRAIPNMPLKNPVSGYACQMQADYKRSMKLMLSI